MIVITMQYAWFNYSENVHFCLMTVAMSVVFLIPFDFHPIIYVGKTSYQHHVVVLGVLTYIANVGAV